MGAIGTDVTGLPKKGVAVKGKRPTRDPLPQPPYPVLARTPVHGVPAQVRVLRPVRLRGRCHPGHHTGDQLPPSDTGVVKL